MSIFEHDAEGSGVAELPGTATGHAFVVHGFACLGCCLELGECVYRSVFSLE